MEDAYGIVIFMSNDHKIFQVWIQILNRKRDHAFNSYL